MVYVYYFIVFMISCLIGGILQSIGLSEKIAMNSMWIGPLLFYYYRKHAADEVVRIEQEKKQQAADEAARQKRLDTILNTSFKKFDDLEESSLAVDNNITSERAKMK